MGQRHQIYYEAPEIYYNANNPNNKPAHIEALHHQWLYGSLPIKALSRLVQFIQNDGLEYLSSKPINDIMKAIYSIDYATGYYDPPHLITQEITGKSGIDFKNGDNNDGITILKLPKYPDKKLKYCFMAFCGTEGQRSLENFKPFSAEEYFASYYPNKDAKTPNISKELDMLKVGYGTIELLTLEEVKAMFPASFQ